MGALPTDDAISGIAGVLCDDTGHDRFSAPSWAGVFVRAGIQPMKGSSGDSHHVDKLR
jgi:hypothetical protein